MDLIENQLDSPLRHWYYAHKFKEIKKRLKGDLATAKNLIDVGAGSALFSLELLRQYHGLRCTAIDPSFDEIALNVEGLRITYLQKPNHLQGDIYLFTDVLEHVMDDVDFLASYVESAKVGAKFIITVPAFMSLWSGHDIYLKHFRRYRKNDLCQSLAKSGLEVESANYLYVSLFPIALLMRSLPRSRTISSQLKDQGVILNYLIKEILKSDQFFSKFMPFGISIIAVAKKVHPSAQHH